MKLFFLVGCTLMLFSVQVGATASEPCTYEHNFFSVTKVCLNDEGGEKVKVEISLLFPVILSFFFTLLSYYHYWLYGKNKTVVKVANTHLDFSRFWLLISLLLMLAVALNYNNILYIPSLLGSLYGLVLIMRNYQEEHIEESSH